MGVSIQTAASSVGQALKALPLGHLIRVLGEGIADAQYALDQKSIEITRMMAGSGTSTVTDVKGNTQTINYADYKIDFGGKNYSLLELGFTPSFYQFTETTLEVKMTVEMKIVQDEKWGYDIQLYCGTLTAENSNKFQISANATTIMKTKLVPLPPPAILEERVRLLLEAEKAA